MKVLHILHRSVPGTHGYGITSKYIVECQKQLSLDPVVITSPFQSGMGDNGKLEYINGIPYFRANLFAKIGGKEVRSSSMLRSAPRFPLIILFALEALRISKAIKPSVIHAHSPSYCGLIAWMVSKIVDIPYVYEVRGVWEDPWSGRSGSGIKGLPIKKALRWLEGLAIRRADAVVVISEHLRNELRERGLRSHVYIVPNG